jgi:hypothetical protein
MTVLLSRILLRNMGADCKFTGTNLHFLIGVMEHAEEFHKQKIYFLQGYCLNTVLLDLYERDQR